MNIKQKLKTSKKEVIFLAFLVIAIFFINYSYLDKKIQNFIYSQGDYEIAIASRIIDGDTLEIKSGEKIRLLGINTPEKGEKYYEEAKDFLNKSIFNKTIELEFSKDKYDKYKRVLAYVYLKEENLNLEIVRNGFANPYFPSGKDIHYNKFILAWNECINKNLNLCRKSEDKCSLCIELKNFDYRKEEIVFYNKCNFSCDLTGWNIKDEGRKKFVFENFILGNKKEVRIKTGNGTNSESRLFWKDETYVWTRTGDTLFLRDKEGDLVLEKRY